MFGDFWGILEKLVRCEKIKNIHQFEANRENEVLRPIRPPNSIGGQIWPHIWNLWPQLHMLTCLFRLIWPSFELWLRKKERRRKFVSIRPVGFAAGKKRNMLWMAPFYKYDCSSFVKMRCIHQFRPNQSSWCTSRFLLKAKQFLGFPFRFTCIVSFLLSFSFS